MVVICFHLKVGKFKKFNWIFKQEKLNVTKEALLFLNKNLLPCLCFWKAFVQYFKRTSWKLGHCVLLNLLQIRF